MLIKPIPEYKSQVISAAEHSAYVVFGTTKTKGRNFFERAREITDFERRFTDIRKVRSGFDHTCDDYLENVKQSIKSPVWQSTGRGTLVFNPMSSSPNDIVDTGELLKKVQLKRIN